MSVPSFSITETSRFFALAKEIEGMANILEMPIADFQQRYCGIGWRMIGPRSIRLPTGIPWRAAS